MNLKTKFSLWVSLAVIFGCLSCAIPTNQVSVAIPISHGQFDKLLKKHVDASGMVNYKGFVTDSVALAAYLDYASKSHPNSNNWSKDEQLAYWINIYNAATIQLVIRHYPVASIKDVAGFIPFVNSPWDVKFIHVEGETYDLNNIEHGIIRPNFDEPRIHFALVCAAVSCPKLRNEAYTADQLESQLEDQARSFFNNPEKNELAQNAISISNLLDWYKSDFTGHGKSLIGYINQYSNVKIDETASISYLDYSWDLNEQ